MIVLHLTKWRPLLWPNPLPRPLIPCGRGRGVKSLDRKGLLVWGNWPDPSEGGGAGRVSPSLSPLLSPLLFFLLFSLFLFLFWTVFGFNIKKIEMTQKMTWEKCPLFSGKKRLCKIVNSSLFSRILKGNTLTWWVLIKELLNDRFLFFDGYRSIQIVYWRLVEFLSLVVFKQLIHFFQLSNLWA